MLVDSGIIKNLAQEYGLTYNGVSNIATGVIRGYTVLLRREEISSIGYVTISFCAKRPDEGLAMLGNGFSLPADVRYRLNRFQIDLTYQYKMSIGKGTTICSEAIRYTVDFFVRTGMENCDSNGVIGRTQSYKSKGQYVFMSGAGAEDARERIKSENRQMNAKPVHLLRGIFGAIAVAIVFLGGMCLFGREEAPVVCIAVFSSFAMVAAFKFLAGRYTLPGTIICAFLVVSETLIAANLFLTIGVVRDRVMFNMAEYSYVMAFFKCRMILEHFNRIGDFKLGICAILLVGLLGGIGFLLFEAISGRRGGTIKKM